MFIVSFKDVSETDSRLSFTGLDEIEAAAGLVQKVKSSKKRATREPETPNIDALLDHGILHCIVSLI